LGAETIPLRDSAGFTLWELLWTVLIASVALGLGVPSFRTFALDSRRTADVNALVLAVQLARSEAAKRGRPVVVCASADGVRCTDPKRHLDAGWIVFVNEDEARPPQRSAAEPVLYVHQSSVAGTITANRDLFEFWPFLGHRSTNGSVVFCDARGARAARAVIVSYTGRPRVDSVAADGGPLTCARLS
jgi:type IV fimbrial biogenesis protein FimT